MNHLVSRDCYEPSSQDRAGSNYLTLPLTLSPTLPFTSFPNYLTTLRP